MADNVRVADRSSVVRRASSDSKRPLSSMRLSSSLETLLRAARWALACALMSLVLTSPAAATGTDPDPDFWRTTPEREHAVDALVYTESAQNVPASLGNTGATVALLRDAQRDLPPNNPLSKDIWRGFRNLGPGSGAGPFLRELGTIGLAVGTFELGVKIGNGINAKFLKIGLPEPPQPKTSPANGFLRFRAKGSTSTYNTTPMPEDAWILKYGYNGQQWDAVNLWAGWQDGCAYLTGRPAYFHVLTGFSSVGWCTDAPPVESYWIGEDELEALGPIEDFNGQSYDGFLGPPTPPSVADVQDAIRLRLALQEYAKTRDFLNFHLGSPGQPDPVSNDFNMPDCTGATWQACESALAAHGITMYRTYDIVEDSPVAEGSITASEPAPGTRIDPDDSTTPVVVHIRIDPKVEEEQQICDDQYSNDRTASYPSALTQQGNPLEFTPVPTSVGLVAPLYGAAVNPMPTQDGDQVFLYYGRTSLTSSGWNGFGWYHIKAKHGWNATSDQRTRQALLTGLRRTQTNRRQVYLDFSSPFLVSRGATTRECAQFVVVDRIAAPKPLGIVTSFGRDLPGYVAGLMR